MTWSDKLQWFVCSCPPLFRKSIHRFQNQKTPHPTNEWSNTLRAACSAIDAKLSSVIICSKSSPKMRTTTCKTNRGESTVSGVLGMFLASTQTFSGVVWVPRVSFLSIWLQVSTLHMKSILCFEACHPCQNHLIVSRFSQINSWTTCKFWKMNLL